MQETSFVYQNDWECLLVLTAKCLGMVSVVQCTGCSCKQIIPVALALASLFKNTETTLAISNGITCIWHGQSHCKQKSKKDLAYSQVCCYSETQEVAPASLVRNYRNPAPRVTLPSQRDALRLPPNLNLSLQPGKNKCLLLPYCLSKSKPEPY